MEQKPIENPRAAIDSIDTEILRLLNKRAEIALAVGAVKTEANAALCDPVRENDVISRLRAENPGPLDAESIENIFQRIIDESLNLQQEVYLRRTEPKPEAVKLSGGRSRIAFLGEHGTFSETAAIGILGEDHEFISFPNFDELYTAIGSGAADYIISPLENSLVGSIHRCYDLLLASTLNVIAEIILPVSHYLVAPPGATMETIRTVESHPAALGQCERFFRAHPDLQAIACDDTAGGVRRAVESGDPTRAGIGGKRTAELYGGQILRSHIEDHDQNFTRFVLLAADPEPAGGSKISLVVRLKDRPGALHGALRPFVRRNIDLTKIESRPVKGRPTEFNFYMDLRAPENENDLKGALDELGEEAEEMRFLGRYPTVRLDGDRLDDIS